jgi:hypothetical protein
LSSVSKPGEEEIGVIEVNKVNNAKLLPLKSQGRSHTWRRRNETLAVLEVVCRDVESLEIK